MSNSRIPAPIVSVTGAVSTLSLYLFSRFDAACPPRPSTAR
jgi:hypothetical protein